MSFIRIRKHYLHTPYLLLGIIEFFLLFASWHFGLKVQGVIRDFSEAYTGQFALSATVFSVILSCTTLSMGVYISLMREGYVNMILRTLVSFCLLGSIALLIINAILPELQLGPENYFWAILIALAFTLFVRWLFSLTVDIKQLQRRIIIYGAGETAHQILDAYRENSADMSVQIIGCVQGSNLNIDVEAEMLIDAPEDWYEFCRQNRITEIVVAPDERRRSQGGTFPLDQMLVCKLRGIEVTEAISFYERNLNRIKLSLLHPSWILFSDGFKVSKSRDFAKRIFDIAVSLLLSVVMAPFVLLTALAVFLETGRPILYHQTRVGENGKEFRIYKFRSMRQDAEKAGQAVWASKNDNRITKVGAVIRNTRLDELPQLWNVIKGDMSFVGPRPERPQFVEQLKEQIPFYNTRHQVKPGLMGWAQLKYPYGASVEDARNKLEYDLYYTKNHSFLMDILILIQTVEVVLLGKGVH